MDEIAIHAMRWKTPAATARFLPMLCGFAAGVFATTLGAAFGQESAAKASFEVVSVKAVEPGPNSMWIGTDADAGRVRYTNITLKDCIRTAYRVRDFQIQGPAWISDNRYEITAKLGEGGKQRIPEMMQTLLSERFGLKLRRETKEQTVSALIVANGGPSLKASDPDVVGRLPTALGPGGLPRPGFVSQVLTSGVQFRAPATTIATVADFVSRWMDRPVVDLTGLEGLYDMSFVFFPDKAAGVSAEVATLADGRKVFPEPGPTLAEAVRQFGLRLEVRKVALELLTVEEASKVPSAN